MSSTRLIPAPQDAVWDALNDPGTLRSCIAGCEHIERVGPDTYDVAMAVRVGPVSARFKGRMSLSDIVEPLSYVIRFEGQGGVAGFAKGQAAVSLAPEGAGTLLSYTVHAQIGGKLAQLGARLVDSSARKMADEFFGKFLAHFEGHAAAAT
ncbi:CoxG family protein [Pigmentiphaga litoralis]|uniref:CoxG family protein n=1 Tax=Pigmentiphaga litoralis TaxID=516702 RepID=UPI003B43986B